jgi:hypothetical protein
MKICTKCHQPKELDQFQKYWHSTQQKERTRAECTECLYKQRNERKRLKRLKSDLIQISIPTEIVQPEVPELEPEILEDFSSNKDYKQCRTCKEWKTKDKFYLHKSKSKSTYLDCKSCCNKVEAARAKVYRQQELEENGGSFRHYKEPNRWIDDIQRDATFDILKAIGWKFNEEKGIWWKEGIKNENGEFLNVKKGQKRIYRKTKLIRKSRFTKEIIEDMKHLRNMGKTFQYIADKYECTLPTVYKWINYEDN